MDCRNGVKASDNIAGLNQSERRFHESANLEEGGRQELVSEWIRREGSWYEDDDVNSEEWMAEGVKKSRI